LDDVKSISDHRWLAKCPAHDDRRPSLSIRELDDGRVLVHDFGGCRVQDVLAAVGLGFDSLYPERAIDHNVRRERRPFDALGVLRALGTELTIVVIYVADIRAGRIPSHADHQRFLLAVNRIVQAKEYCDGK
jgi:hypothetical protein